MSLYCARLPVAGSVGLEVEADSEEEAIEKAFRRNVVD